MVEEQMAQQCCFVEKQPLLYSQPGDYILYHRKEAQVKCKKGWTGDNCDACAAGWTGDNCDECAPGWLPPGCSTCRFGFSTESNCTECITNGLWTGTANGKDLTLRLTFNGETCSEVVPGKQTCGTKHETL